jgi:hypothetical protein
MRLALNMIARNEAPRIARALACAVKVCDELIVVDTGSTDGTQEIARAFGATVIEWPWRDDFAAARNVALDNTTADWVLVLDADDEISSTDIAGLLDMKERLDDSYDAVFAVYEYAFTGDVCTCEITLQRLIRRTSGLRWKRRVHEFFDVAADRARVTRRFRIQHRGFGKQRVETSQQLRLLERMYADGDRTARTLWYLAGELHRAGDADRARLLFRDVIAAPDASTYERYDAAKMLHFDAIARESLADAVAATDLMLEIDAARPDAHILRGAMAFDAGDLDGAIAMIERGLACLMPRDGIGGTDLVTWVAHGRLARAYAAKGMPANALRHAELARPTHPDPASIDELITECRAIVGDTLVAGHNLIEAA